MHTCMCIDFNTLGNEKKNLQYNLIYIPIRFITKNINVFLTISATSSRKVKRDHGNDFSSHKIKAYDYKENQEPYF